MTSRRLFWASAGIMLVLFSLWAMMLPALAEPAPRQVATVDINLTGTIPPTVIVLPTAAPPTAIPTVPPGFVPPSPSPVGCAQPLPLSVGSTISLEPGVNLRNIPNLNGAVTNYYQIETLLIVQEGPVCNNGYNWWRVSGSGEPGWAVEGRPGRYFITLIDTTDRSCFEPLDLSEGDEALILTGVAVNALPDPNSLTLHALLTGENVVILGEPICREGLNWWRVRAPFGSAGQNRTVEGWIGEGYPLDQYWIQPRILPTQAPYCLRPLRLFPGVSRAAVTYADGVARTLRAAPDQQAQPIQSLIAGVAFDIIGGPVCADGFNFWQVRLLVTGQVGWIAEGRPGNYWFDIIFQ
ncbi:MAG: hypothetical protein KME04_13275 [Pleurocapsa minor GSE-CHR-MK-17-07R]|jgi:hypothetical protein|nr:hypothetical protein [Pleurocapsa minor GSE-CHR-MK 17-07R]